MLNSAVAESLRIYADRLEQAEDFETALHEMIKKTIKDHKRIIFNGNGYDDAWIREATQVRGLSNYRTTADCMPHLLDKKNKDMLLGLGVFSEAELKSRYEILLDNYCKVVTIEAHTMVQMAKTQIIPAIQKYTASVAEGVQVKKSIDSSIPCKYDTSLVKKLSGLVDSIADYTVGLEQAIDSLGGAEDIGSEAAIIRDTVLPAMETLRAPCDEAETLTAKAYWPYPTYGDLLFGVR
jgi:glutamine synthetase